MPENWTISKKIKKAMAIREVLETERGDMLARVWPQQYSGKYIFEMLKWILPEDDWSIARWGDRTTFELDSLHEVQAMMREFQPDLRKWGYLRG